MSKVVPIGGEHKSAHSLLAEVMSDPTLESVVVITFRKGTDDVGWGVYQMSAPDLCYAAKLIERLAFDETMP